MDTRFLVCTVNTITSGFAGQPIPTRLASASETANPVCAHPVLRAVLQCAVVDVGFAVGPGIACSAGAAVRVHTVDTFAVV